MTAAHFLPCQAQSRAPHSHWLWAMLLASSSIVFDGLTAANVQAQPAVTTATDEYQFDDNIMFGGGSLSRFNKINAVDPGNYTVDVYLNNRFVERVPVQFVETAKGDVQPCVPRELLVGAGVLSTAITDTPDSDCPLLSDSVKGASSHFDFAQLRLDISMPQSLMLRVPRGFVSTQSLDAGTTIGFVNYSANQYHVSRNTGGVKDTDSSYVSLNSGLNFGMWRLRQQASVRYDSEHGTDWNATRTYVQRALPSLRSELTAGEGYTSGRFFSGLGFRGVQIASDDRMLPESIRGYAPTVRGIAKTNAKVTVRQNGNDIYEATVAPGPFEISDLYATNYNGDLDVTVQEADGTVSYFSVPFSAVPESLRPGTSRYSAAVGKTSDVGDNDVFGEVTYQRGMTNDITTNTGLRVADGYQALVLGGVYSNWLGAFGLDTTYSRADMPQEGLVDGWMARLSYSRTFAPTNTTLSIAGYRYSTAGYRDLGDVLGVRESLRSGHTWESASYLQRSRFEVSVNQSLESFGSIYVSGSTQDYRNGRERDTQLQLGYANTLRNSVSFNVSVSRQSTGNYQPGRNGEYDGQSNGNNVSGGSWNAASPGSTETVTLLSVSFPLGSPSKNNTPTLSSSISHSATYGDVYQTSLSGTAGEEQTLSYGVDVSHDAEQKQNTWSGNVQKRLPKTSLALSASKGEDYWQASGSARGAVAIHGGGVTFGPYLGDTFALVEAKGASGAKIMNGQGAAIDGAGYALVPSLTPYRYNTIAITPEGMNQKTELDDGQRRVAPYAGAAVKIKFKTRSGNALLVKAVLANNEAAPMGADVLDENGHVIGMVGQGSQAYLRSEHPQGTLTLRWGDRPEEQCALRYDVTDRDLDQPLLRVTSECRPL